MLSYAIIGCHTVIIISLITISYIDWRDLRIPDTLVLIVGVSASIVAYAISPYTLFDGVLAGVIGYVVLGGVRLAITRIIGREAMGYGDVKLISAGAIWIGTDWLPQSILIACITAFGVMVLKKLIEPTYTFDQHIPFGPFLSFGLMLAKLISILSLNSILIP